MPPSYNGSTLDLFPNSLGDDLMNETKQKGLITELQCELAFSEIGILLSQPIIDDSRYDYIADLNSHFIKIQCKTSSVGEDGDYIQFSARSTRANTGEIIQRHYTKDEIDYFYTYYNGKSYLIPVEECSTTKKLRFTPPRNNQTNYNKAEDYELITVLQKLENYNNFQYHQVNYIGKKINYCEHCGKEINEQSKICLQCLGLKNRIVEQRPNREELKLLIRTKSFLQIGSDYNVSDNAIRKWCDSYNLPRTKKEINSYSDEEWENI